MVVLQLKKGKMECLGMRLQLSDHSFMRVTSHAQVFIFRNEYIKAQLIIKNLPGATKHCHSQLD